MALIPCPKCGQQISSRAAACPHCGNSAAAVTNQTGGTANISQTPQPVMYNASVHRAAKKNNTAIVVVGIVIAAALILLAIVILTKGNGDNPTSTVNNAATVPSDVYTPTEPVIVDYNVTLSVQCRENLMMNKYDVDILVDGQFLDTLKHGTYSDYALKLSEGSHKFEFRISGKDVKGNDLYQKGDPGSFQTMTFNVNEDTEVGYYVKLTKGNNIDVERS